MTAKNEIARITGASNPEGIGTGVASRPLLFCSICNVGRSEAWVSRDGCASSKRLHYVSPVPSPRSELGDHYIGLQIVRHSKYTDKLAIVDDDFGIATIAADAVQFNLIKASDIDVRRKSPGCPV